METPALRRRRPSSFLFPMAPPASEPGAGEPAAVAGSASAPDAAAKATRSAAEAELDSTKVDEGGPPSKQVKPNEDDDASGATEEELVDGDAVVAAARRALAALCDTAKIDASHGVEHASVVLGHTEAAIAATTTPLPPARALAVRLAALLHDADDKKYFPDTAKTLGNARKIMAEAGAPAGVVADAAAMIGWVSCSKNGNDCPPEAEAHPELLWPRWADRLEAAGEIGVVRCYQFNQHDGATPLALASTPRPRSEAEAFALATGARFAAYQASGGGSASMIDHYYDKLLQVARPPPELVRNAYLETAALAGAAPLLKVCLAFGETGEVPVPLIEEMAANVGLALET